MFIESKTFNGLGMEDMAEVYALIGPSLGKSRTADEAKPKRKRVTGTVRKFNDPKGYGFINYGPDDASIFYHIKDVVDPGVTYLRYGERVSFEIGTDKQGRKQAEKIVLIGGIR